MRIMPRKGTFEIQTHLTRDAVREMLKNKVAKTHVFSSPENVFFQGKVNSDRFDIREVVGYTWALLPVFHGRLEGDNDDVRVCVTASNPIMSLAVIYIWLSTLAVFYVAWSCAFEDANITGGIAFLIAGFGCVGMGFFFSVFYWRKVRDGKALLLDMLRGSN